MNYAEGMNPIKAEAAFVALIQRHGVPRTGARVLDIQPPIVDDGETDCWSHAWDLARATGGRYVEGLCRRTPARSRIATHAWVERNTPFGVQIIETTKGYEHASEYRGLVIDTAPGSLAVRLTKDWPKNEPRSSVLQAALAGGWTWEAILDEMIARRAARARKGGR